MRTTIFEEVRWGGATTLGNFLSHMPRKHVFENTQYGSDAACNL